jgi:hypothetical protein
MVAGAPHQPTGYGHLDEDDSVGEATEATTPGGTRSAAWDRGLNSLDDLAGFFQTAITELRNPHPVEARCRGRSLACARLPPATPRARCTRRVRRRRRGASACG